jgi:P pilus assembly chaperone PapD
MNVEPILLMASAVLLFALVALGVAAIFGVAIGQARVFFNRKNRV